MHLSHLASLLTSFAAVVAQAPPPNDTCATAIPVSNGTFAFSNFGATQGGPTWSCPGNSDVWFLYLAGGTGTLSVNTCGSAINTVIEVFDGTSGCGASTLLGCNDNSACGPGSSLSVVVASGPYFIRVGSSGMSPPGPFNLQVNGPAAGASVAMNAPLGAGCGGRYGSIYEQFDHQTFDLANTTLTWQLTSNGYVVTRSAGAQIVPPTGMAVAVAGGAQGQQLFPLPVPLPVPEGSVSALNVTTIGQVELGSAAFAALNLGPSSESLLEWPTAIFACWHNFLPVPVGAVTFQIVGGTAAHATWNGVFNGGFGTSTFQFRFDLLTGDVRLAIANVSVWAGAPGQLPQCVVGFSPAGGSPDPGERDLSALTALALPGDDAPLRLIGTVRPRVGTLWTLAVSSVPPSAFAGFDVFGHTDPGIGNLAAIGMPGCGLRSSLDVVTAWPVTGPTHGYSLAIPGTVSLAGVRIYSTSAVLTSPPANAFGMLTANGVEGLLGVL